MLDDISSFKYIYTSKKNGIANGVITEDLEVEMFYPEDVHDYIDISGFITSRDENTEEQIKEDYKKTVSEEKLSKLKVYEVRCDYIIKKESNIIFQPKIKIKFSGKEQDLVPFEPICFFNN